MSEKIIQPNEGIIKEELKALVRNSVEKESVSHEEESDENLP
jgi:hypothetical protein